VSDGFRPAPSVLTGFTPAVQAAENLVNACMVQRPYALDPELVLEQIKASDTADEMLVNLAALLKPENVRDYALVLERGLFAAQAQGFVHSEEGTI
jgi:hypothetical protein